MPEIRPFRGLYYNPELVGDLAAVVAPPYDVISPEEQKQYYARHPYNVIRLELGEDFPTDTAEDNRYTRARDYLHQWLTHGVLTMDTQPAFYLLEDEFPFQGKVRRRTGLVAALKTDAYEAGAVLPHEDTLPRAKADRLALLEACEANFSSIFALYRDEAHEVHTLLAPHMTAPPLLELSNEEGERHRLWRLADRETTEALRRLFAGKTLYIADGHHRYETAYQFALRRGPAYAWVLTTLVALDDPGLVVLPTHRLVRGVGSINWHAVTDLFARRSFRDPRLTADPSPLASFLDSMAASGAAAPCFALYTGGDTLDLAFLRDPERAYKLLGKQPQARKQLDVTVLHELFLPLALGAAWQEGDALERFAYTRDPGEAWAAVRRGEFDLAVFLNPPRLAQITAVAAAGARMPQKSTYFWPKLLTGLVMCCLGEGIS